MSVNLISKPFPRLCQLLWLPGHIQRNVFANLLLLYRCLLVQLRIILSGVSVICNETKFFINESSEDNSNYLQSLERLKQRQFIGIITGHSRGWNYKAFYVLFASVEEFTEDHDFIHNQHTMVWGCLATILLRCYMYLRVQWTHSALSVPDLLIPLIIIIIMWPIPKDLGSKY